MRTGLAGLILEEADDAVEGIGSSDKRDPALEELRRGTQPQTVERQSY